MGDVQIGDLQFLVSDKPEFRRLLAFLGGVRVGVMLWGYDGLFQNVQIAADFRRRKIATRMWEHAREIAPDLRMTPYRTDAGHAWAATLGTGVERIEDPAQPWSMRGAKP